MITLLLFITLQVYDIPEDRLPPVGELWRWQQIEILVLYEPCSYEMRKAWVIMPKETFVERNGRTIAALAGSVTPLVITIITLLLKRRNDGTIL